MASRSKTSKPVARDINRGLTLTRRPAIARDADPPARRVTGDGLVNFVSGLGTSRDKRSSSFFVPSLATFMDWERAFQFNWLAGRIITTVADDMTREGWQTSWDGHDDDEGAVKALQDAEQEFDLQGKANAAETWARLYGGATIVIMIKNDIQLDKPLDVTKIKKGDLEALCVIDRQWITPTGSIDRKPGPNFGLPEFYQISDSTTGVPLVHWSRVVRFNGRKLPKTLWLQNGMWDASELQQVLENIADYDGSRANVAALVWEACVDIFKQKGLADALATAEGTTQVTNRYQTGAMLKSTIKALVLDKEDEEYSQKNVTFAGLDHVMQTMMTDVCGAADIPMTRLFGQSPAGMTATGESDIRNYYDHVAARQQTSLKPQLMRIYQVLVRHVMGRMPDGFAVTFNPLWQLSDKERAEMNFQQAQADQIYETIGAIHVGVIARKLMADGTYPQMEDEDVEMAEDLAKEPPPAPLPPKTPPGAPSAGTPPQPARDSKVGDMIRRDANGWNVYSENGEKHLGGPYSSKAEALKRLAQVEHFKDAA